MKDLLPYKAYYINSAGRKLCLSEYPVILTGGDLFDSVWRITTSKRPLSEGGRLISKRRPCTERTMQLKIATGSAQKLSELLEQISEIFDYDIQQETAGRLYINSRYLRCWCGVSKKELSHDFISTAAITVGITPEYPTWHTDRVFNLLAGETDDPEDGHSYNYSYPKRYGNTMGSIKLVNNSVTPAPMKIVFFGPADYPRIFVDGNEFGVNMELGQGEYAVIDQLERTVYSVATDGKITNRFDSRVKNGICFEYVAPGSHKAELLDAAGVQITITEQRSEPQWVLS